MTAIVTPINSGGGGGGGGTSVAQNERGSVSGLVAGATHTLITTPWGARMIKGFRATGSEDGEVWIEVDATPLAGFRSRISRVMDAYIIMPNPESLASSATVTLRVQNTGDAPGDFEAMLFAE